MGQSPVWKSERFREIDGSITSWVLSGVRGIVALFVGFAAAELITDGTGIEGGAAHVVVTGAIGAVIAAVALYITTARRFSHNMAALREAIDEHERTLAREASNHQFANNLQNALEMVDNEDDALSVVADGLGILAEAPAELLLADSSRAHLRRAVSFVPEWASGPPGCQVESPWRCPAVRRGQHLVFADSDALGSCPHLKGRVERGCSAVCVPVTVLGNPVGVIHMIGPKGVTPSLDTINQLQTLAMQAGARVGVLRAMARSQLQAATDPLTGMLNRRSLEHEVRRLRESAVPYAVAVADLDHFKRLNDTHGHETGDRALRLFARTLRDSVRAEDIVCRYGGEEFVVVFPGCTVVEAASIVHRARTALERAVAAGDVPAFTASYGLADSADDLDFDDVMRAADSAMFRAKEGGRDRLVVADPQAA